MISGVLAKPRLDAIILVRDMDQQPDERTASLEQARAEVPMHAMTIVLALPRAKREAWVLNGFEPQTANEDAALGELREELGFDPVTRSEQLDATKHGAKRDAKRVLTRLTRGNHEREARCWRETPWSLLRQRGVGSNLVRFLGEVKEVLVPLVTGQRV